MTNGKRQLSERPSLCSGGWREISLLSQPIITALNISRENNVKFRLKEQSIQEAEGVEGGTLKETWLTYENNYS